MADRERGHFVTQPRLQISVASPDIPWRPIPCVLGRIWGFVWRGGAALLALWLAGMKGAQQLKWIGPDPVLEFLPVIGAGLWQFLRWDVG